MHAQIRNEVTHTYARRSLGALLATAISTTLHHVWRLGPGAALIGLVTIGGPIATLLWFRKTRSPFALTAYSLVATWLVVSFGLVDGMWKSTIKLFLGHYLMSGHSAYFSWAPVGSFGFEATGILASVFCLFAAYDTARFVASAVRDLSPIRARAFAAMGAAALGLGLLGVGGLAIARGRPRVSLADEPLKIGVLIPKVGASALLGDSFLKAVQLAADELPPTRRRYELVVEDTGQDAIQTRRAVQKLIGQDKVSAIVGGISLPGEITAPYARQAQIPHVCVCSVASIADGKFNFTNIPVPEDEGIRWVEEAKRRGIRRVAFLTQDYPSIDGHVRAVQAEMAPQGLEVSYRVRFPGGVKDFAAMISEAEASKPDVYFVEALEPGLDLLGQQLKERGIRNLASVVAFSVADRPELFEDAWYTDSNVDPAFRARFEKKYPGTRFATHMMPYAYDSLRLVVAALDSGQPPAEYLRNVTAFDGTPGRVSRAPGSGNFRSRPSVWVIKQGKPTLVD